VWEGCTPVFVDIDPETLNIDSSKIEAAITLRTSGILATHVYGNPCDIEAIDIIAKKHNLKVIYDAAHGFGTKYKAKSIFAYGDVSTTSFHATKLFHTVEGGAVMTQNPEILKRMAYMRNFGHDGYDRFNGVGINGKNSEFHAAMGLAILPYMHEILRKRRELTEYYNRTLVSVNRQLIKLQPGAEYNYAYYPVILPSEQFLLNVVEELNKNWIYPRRYFYPSLSELPYVKRKHECPVCEDIARRILCLPLYHTLTFEEIDLIARLMLRAQNY
jgi:dTDP-4-amino-4,6-dideoxygalactose transaminase